MKKVMVITLLAFSLGANAQEWNQYDANRDGVVDVADITAVANYILHPNKPDDPFNGHEYVDLALPSGIKWATMNVGATTPEGYGDYFAWGEIEAKTNYSWNTYKWCEGTSMTMTKYCNKGGYGTVDNETTLYPEDDVAQVKWGGDWRMPTYSELSELVDKCTWTKTTLNGVNGYLVTSATNGNSIFLPAAGIYSYERLDKADTNAYFWSSTLSNSAPYKAGSMYFSTSDSSLGYWLDNESTRYGGRSVRPVCP